MEHIFSQSRHGHGFMSGLQPPHCGPRRGPQCGTVLPLLVRPPCPGRRDTPLATLAGGTVTPLKVPINAP